MELPRRRGGAYEHRSVVGNILTPTSGPHGSAELRTTPSTRGAAAAASSRPPWATEPDAPPSGPSGRPPSASRQHPANDPRSARDDFSFATPDHSPASASHARPPSAGRARGPPADQLDVWSQQHRPASGGPGGAMGAGGAAASRRGDSPGMYARVDHHDDGEGPPQGSHLPAPGLGRRSSTTSAPAPPIGRNGSGSGGGRLQSGDMSSADAGGGGGGGFGAGGRGGVGAGPGGRAGAAAAPASRASPGGSAAASLSRVGASPARGARGPTTSTSSGAGGFDADARGAGGGGGVRSTSTPKPRPSLAPKRSTSITDNVQRDWVDVAPPATTAAPPRGSRPGAGRGGSAGAVAATRWDTEPSDADRGSWLYAGDAVEGERQQEDRGALDLAQARARQEAVPERRRLTPPPPPPPQAEWEAPLGRDSCAADHSGDIDAAGGGGGGGGNFGRRARPPSAGSSAGAGLEATLTPVAPTAASFTFGGGGGSGGGGMSLGHGLAAAGPAAGSGGGGGSSGSVRLGSGGGGRQQAADPRQMQALQDENARLRDQVEHMQRLMAAATPTAAATDLPGNGSGVRRGAMASGRPSSAAESRDPGAVLAAANAGGVSLQQYKSQVIQLQRQVALMSQEMEGKSRLAAEAEGVLLDAAARLEDLAASSGASAAASGGVSGEQEPLSRERLAQLHKWSKQMLGRLRGEKSQSAKIFTRQDLHSGTRGGGGGGGGGGGMAPSWGDPSPSSAAAGVGGGAAAPAWHVPFISAGGNRFLLAAAAAAAASDDLAGAAGGGGFGGSGSGGTVGPSVAAIAGGHAALLADPLLAHRLELQLAAVAPKLAAVAVLLKSQLLPAMPWLGLETADRLQAEVGEAAESVAQVADSLVQLCSLLPAGAAVFGDAPVAQEPRRRAAEVEAGRDSWLYGSPELLGQPPELPVVDEAGLLSVSRLQAAIGPLLRDRKTGAKTLADILEPLRAKAQSGAAKRATLESELRFAARAAAVSAEHVSHLMLSVGMALEDCRGAKDAAAIRSYFAASAAVRQVLEAADSLELHPCENCLKALVEVIRSQRDCLDTLPDLLVNAPAADVEGRLLGKVEELHRGFKKALGKLDAHKRRHLDAQARCARGEAGGGDGGADGDGDGDEEDGDGGYSDDEDHRGDGFEGGGAARQGGGQGVASTRKPAAGGSGGAAKAGKPPRPAASPPRPEWGV